MSSLSASELKELHQKLSLQFNTFRPRVIQPAEGYLKHPYLIPAGYYKQMWDWDAFFMGCHFLHRGQPEYLRYWALNLLEGVDEDGYVAGCATTAGPRPILGNFAMKPFLSQGVYFAAQAENDFDWVRENYPKLVRVLNYRDQTQRDEATGLYFWENAMQSGADNNPALNYEVGEKGRFLAADASALQYREFQAQARIAEILGHQEEALSFQKKAEELKQAINMHLWHEDDQCFYNRDTATGELLRCVSYSSFIPLMAGIAPEENGRAMITRYLLSPEHMKAEFGLRSLSKRDPAYNNENIINPFSNWQGPVWPIANYLYSIALHRYGFHEDNKWLASTLGTLLLDDAQKWDTMHENYHADTGAPLAPSHEHKDEDGKIVGFISWNLCIENLLAGVVEDEWMLLKV